MKNEKIFKNDFHSKYIAKQVRRKFQYMTMLLIQSYCLIFNKTHKP